MYRRAITTLAALAALTMAAAPVAAVENGQPDREAHGNVGLLGIDLGSDRPFPLCSGFVLSDSVFVTAAHCIGVFGPGANWVVTLEGGSPHHPTFVPGEFDPLTFNIHDFPILASTERAAAVHIHPGYDGVNHDIAVLTFEVGTFDVRPVRLAPEGILDRLDSKGVLERVPARLVGYGTSGITSVDPLLLTLDGYRKWAWTGIAGITSSTLILAPTERHPGVIGLGDSGSAQFVLGYAVSITSSLERFERLDTPINREFLESFMDDGRA